MQSCRGSTGGSSSSEDEAEEEENESYMSGLQNSSPQEKHLYLVLDDWIGGYTIHKLDADNMEDHLPKHAALRLSSPERGVSMAFTTLGSNIFIVTNSQCNHDRAPPILVYNIENAALAVGPRLPHGYLREFRNAVGVNGKLYALTSVIDEHRQSSSLQLQVLSWVAMGQQEPWDPAMAWSWNTAPTPPPQLIGQEIITAYVLHPDGHTIFMSTDGCRTYSLDTSNGVWRDLGEWTLPFIGQAYFDGELDAWVGLHHKEDGYVCCCPVASRRSATTRTRQPLECRILKEKLFRRCDEEKYPNGRYLRATLTYMGDSRFCLVENVLRNNDDLDAVLHVTLFGLKYDHKAELRAKICRTTRSYALSKNTTLFSHAAFWL